MLSESEIDEYYLVKAEDNEGNSITNMCHLCDNPQGIIFMKDDFPITREMYSRTYVCQKCAQGYLEHQKRDKAEFDEFFDEIVGK